MQVTAGRELSPQAGPSNICGATVQFKHEEGLRSSPTRRIWRAPQSPCNPTLRREHR